VRDTQRSAVGEHLRDPLQRDAGSHAGDEDRGRRSVAAGACDPVQVGGKLDMIVDP
jgi:hypothetical protein